MRRDNTLVRVVIVQRKRVVAVQYGAIFRHDGLFPECGKNTQDIFDINF